jgi:thioredoxin-related protein
MHDMIKRAITYILLIVFLVFSGAAVADAASNSLKWYSFKEYATQRSSNDKNIFIHFWAQWCGYCSKMEKVTFRNPQVVSYLNENFFLIKVDTDREQYATRAFRVRGLPYNLFLTNEGDTIQIREGYIPPGKFMKILNAIEASY